MDKIHACISTFSYCTCYFGMTWSPIHKGLWQDTQLYWIHSFKRRMKNVKDGLSWIQNRRCQQTYCYKYILQLQQGCFRSDKLLKLDKDPVFEIYRNSDFTWNQQYQIYNLHSVEMRTKTLSRFLRKIYIYSVKSTFSLKKLPELISRNFWKWYYFETCMTSHDRLNQT